jgi:competence protein ComEC
MAVAEDRDLTKGQVKKARKAVRDAGGTIVVVDPRQREPPIEGTTEVKIRPVLPAEWPSTCAHDPNDCSIPLRIDYCASSVLFTGDAHAPLEATLETGPVTLLQVAHHGSNTSTSAPFLARVTPKYTP